MYLTLYSLFRGCMYVIVCSENVYAYIDTFV